jgi:hypothetical protein
MWYEALGPDVSWARLWSRYVRCGQCSGIRTITEPCIVCGSPPYNAEPIPVRTEDGNVETVRQGFAGAEGRYEDWVYLKLLEREWKRPLEDADMFHEISASARPSPRAVIAILFWTYFETRIERLSYASMRPLESGITQDLLRRYGAIGARLERLYRVLYRTTYQDDLKELGYRDSLFDHE